MCFYLGKGNLEEGLNLPRSSMKYWEKAVGEEKMS